MPPIGSCKIANRAVWPGTDPQVFRLLLEDGRGFIRESSPSGETIAVRETSDSTKLPAPDTADSAKTAAVDNSLPLDIRLLRTTSLWLDSDQAQAVLLPEQLLDDQISGSSGLGAEDGGGGGGGGGGGSLGPEMDDWEMDLGQSGESPDVSPDQLQGLLLLIKQNSTLAIEVSYRLTGFFI